MLNQSEVELFGNTDVMDIVEFSAKFEGVYDFSDSLDKYK